MKEYIKPELEVVTLVTDEAITGDFEIGGEVSLTPNPFD